MTVNFTPPTPINAFDTSTNLGPSPFGSLSGLHLPDSAMDLDTPTRPRDSVPGGVPPPYIGVSFHDHELAARARIVDRPSTPRPSAWSLGNYDSSDSPIPPGDTLLDASPLALTHTSMEIDDIFQNTDFVGSTGKIDSTGTWVNFVGEPSATITEIEDGQDDTPVDVQEQLAGDGDVVEPMRNRDRRNSLPTGSVFGGRGDRLAAPSVGPTGRKRELSGGSSKSGRSDHGGSGSQQRKRMRTKGKGKVCTLARRRRLRLTFRKMSKSNRRREKIVWVEYHSLQPSTEW